VPPVAVNRLAAVLLGRSLLTHEAYASTQPALMAVPYWGAVPRERGGEDDAPQGRG
jgi:hypothetical protein